jgi:hypothetical protein
MSRIQHYGHTNMAAKPATTLRLNGYPENRDVYFAGQQENVTKPGWEIPTPLLKTARHLLLPLTLGLGAASATGYCILNADRAKAESACWPKVQDVKTLNTGCLEKISAHSPNILPFLPIPTIPILICGLLLAREQKKRIGHITGHEQGHLIARWKAAQKLGFDPTLGRSSQVLMEVTPEKGFTSFFPEAWEEDLLQLSKGVNLALETKELHTPAYGEKREKMIRNCRENAIIFAAGPILQEYIHGIDEVGGHSFGGSIDREKMNTMISYIALCTKPLEDWTPDTRKAFIERQRREITQAAHELFQGLDRGVVQEIYETLVAQAKAGKRQWTRGELEPLMKKLDQ